MSNDNTNSEIHAKGMNNRRAILGNYYVDQAIEETSVLNADFQDFMTRYAWGEIWERPGLDNRTRSLLTLSTLLALGQDEEFQLHVKAAINNGVTVEEIKEVLMHSAVYCGVPVANHGFKLAKEVLMELDVL